jgi:hypothetical protein
MKLASLERNGTDAHLWLGPLGFHFWRPGCWSATRPLITFDWWWPSSFRQITEVDPVAGQERA